MWTKGHIIIKIWIPGNYSESIKEKKLMEKTAPLTLSVAFSAEIYEGKKKHEIKYWMDKGKTIT